MRGGDLSTHAVCWGIKGVWEGAWGGPEHPHSVLAYKGAAGGKLGCGPCCYPCLGGLANMTCPFPSRHCFSFLVRHHH